MNERQEQLLRIAFVLGAITDGLAVVPMLFTPMASLLSGTVNTGAGVSEQTAASDVWI